MLLTSSPQRTNRQASLGTWTFSPSLTKFVLFFAIVTLGPGTVWHIVVIKNLHSTVDYPKRKSSKLSQYIEQEFFPTLDWMVWGSFEYKEGNTPSKCWVHPQLCSSSSRNASFKLRATAPRGEYKHPLKAELDQVDRGKARHYGFFTVISF